MDSHACTCSFCFVIFVVCHSPVADLGGAVGGNCPPPLHDDNLAWHPIFGKKGALYPDPKALFFRVSF